MTQSETVKDRLTRARSALGWSKQDLAESSGVAAAQISRYEAGRNEPRSEVVAKLARALNVQFDWLAYGRGPIEGPSNESVRPLGFVGIEAEFSEEELTLIRRYAQAKGLTVEMATRQLVLSMLDPRLDGSGGAAQDDVVSLKKTMNDFARRLADLEGEKNSAQ